MKFTFGDLVVVEGNLIGVVLKCWVKNNESINYDVYVRSYNSIKNYDEDEMERYLVRHKELDEQELEYQHNATHPFVEIPNVDLLRKTMEEILKRKDED